MAFCRQGEDWKLCRHQSKWRRRGKKCSRHWSRDSPAACEEDHGEAGCLPAALGDPRWSIYPPAAHRGPSATADGHPKETVTLWEACTGVGSCQDLWTHGERSPRCSRFAGRTCDPMRTHTEAACSWRTAPYEKRLTLEQFVKSCSLRKGLMLDNLVEKCLLWEGPHAGAEEECEESSLRGGRRGREVW